jgi:hypothetical protein
MATTGSGERVVPDCPASGSVVNSRRLGNGVMLKALLVTLRVPDFAVSVRLFAKFFPAHPENVATPPEALRGLLEQVSDPVPALIVSVMESVEPVPV